MTVLEAQNLTRTYTIGDREIPVLGDVSFSVSAGEFLVVAGGSGSGKRMLAERYRPFFFKDR